MADTALSYHAVSNRDISRDCVADAVAISPRGDFAVTCPVGTKGEIGVWKLLPDIEFFCAVVSDYALDGVVWLDWQTGAVFLTRVGVLVCVVPCVEQDTNRVVIQPAGAKPTPEEKKHNLRAEVPLLDVAVSSGNHHHVLAVLSCRGVRIYDVLPAAICMLLRKSTALKMTVWHALERPPPKAHTGYRGIISRFLPSASMFWFGLLLCVALVFPWLPWHFNLLVKAHE
ncbi:hypothetical protein AURDEDRAFT_161031 [Auricularia subglabra TFB-10046 SS5]|nr:hypothetical protein AURDEDRAFT_161031 [Auricularia subglabra TFB-10046 SS5]